MNPDAETQDAVAAMPAFQPPATLGEIWDANWRAAGLNTPLGVQAPKAQAVKDLFNAYSTTTGQSPLDAAAAAGRPLNLPAIGLDGQLTGKLSADDTDQLTGVIGDLASRLPDAQRDKIAPFLDIDGRAATMAQKAEQDAASVNSRAYGLTGVGTSYVGGLARGLADPTTALGVLVGGPEAGAIGAMLAREFAVNAGFGAASHIVTAPQRQALGLENGSLIGDTLSAGAFGAGLSLLARGAGYTLRKAMGGVDSGEVAPEGYKPAANVPPDLHAELGQFEPADFDAAARFQDRETAMNAFAPDQTMAGWAQAKTATDTAAARIEQPVASDAPMTAAPAAPVELRDGGMAPPVAAREGGAAIGDAAPLDPGAPAPIEPGAGEANREGQGATPAPVEPGSDGAAPEAKPADETVHAYSLLAFLKHAGGLMDDRGELTAMGLVKGYPGLVNNRRGWHLDAAREMAAEAGYLGADTGHAMANTTVSDLLDAIGQHPLYSSRDWEEVARAGDARSANEYAGRVEDASRELDSHMRQQGLKRLDPEWRSTAAELFLEEPTAGADSAIEKAAIQLYERDAEQARLHREEPQLPEVDHEAAALDQRDRYPGDEGAYYGDRSRAEGDADAAPGPLPDAGETGGQEPDQGRDQEPGEDGRAGEDDEAANEPEGQGAQPAAPLKPSTPVEPYSLAEQRADVERALEQADAAGQDVKIIESDESGGTRQVSVRDALRMADDFVAATRELADCILRFGASA